MLCAFIVENGRSGGEEAAKEGVTLFFENLKK
jgi:hypothetical protein